jgi:hypothetical protein
MMRVSFGDMIAIGKEVINTLWGKPEEKARLKKCP